VSTVVSAQIDSTPQAMLYELSRLSLRVGDQPLFQPFDLNIAPGVVTVLLGPGGIGKSKLLQALAGEALPEPFVLEGGLRYCGRALDDGLDGLPTRALLRQISRENGSAGTDEPGAERWQRVLSSGASTLLLDDPTPGCSEAEREALIAALRDHTRRGAAVVVTRDLSFARRVADRVCFFVGGGLHVETSAKEFFEAPPTPLSSHYVERGNCWPSSPLPELPTHFHWLLPGRLAGMGRPGLLSPVEDDLTAIALAGVQLVVNLTEKPPDASFLRGFGLQSRHLAIRDMGVPAVGHAARLCRDIERSITAGRSVAVHCRAGMGRTGTILAATLVWMGCKPDAAIEQVRSVAPGYIQNRQQERFVHDFAEGV